MPKGTHPLRPFLFFCQLWAIGPSWAPIKSLCKLSQLAPKTSSVAPVWTAVFTQGATATGMTGGSALRPIVCRKSTGPTINERPSALPAIGASICATSAEGSSGPSLLPIGIRIAMQLLPGPFPLEATTSRSFTSLKKALDLSKVGLLYLPDMSISLLRMILAVTTMRSSGKPARDARSPLHPKAKPPPTPAQIAAQTRREFLVTPGAITSRSSESEEGYGKDADRAEFRFRDANTPDRPDV